MKVLCIIDSLNSGGAQRQLVNLGIGFKKKGCEVSFLVYHNLNFFKSLLDEHNISVTYIIEPNYFLRLIKIRRYIRNRKVNVVISFLTGANLIAELAGLPTRKWTLIVSERSANPKIETSIRLRMYRWVHILADYVVVNSSETMKTIQKVNPLLSKRKLKVIYNLIELDQWNPISANRVDDGFFRIVVAARHHRLKNLDGLIEGVNLLNESVKQRLKIDWYGSEKDDSLKKGKWKIEKYGLIPIFGFYDDTKNITAIMQRADAIGIFSFYEGFPNVVCEGMSLAKPIVSSAVSDLPVLINKDNGFLCDPRDPISISKSIEALVCSDRDKLREMGKNNRRIAEKMFDSHLIVKQYLSLFR